MELRVPGNVSPQLLSTLCGGNLCLMELGILLVQGPTGPPGVGEKGYTGDPGVTGALKLPISGLFI